jgi:hypothetical protein
MKALKYIGITLAVVIVLVLVVALFISGKVHYEKSISINAPVDSVWQNVGSLSAVDKWSPWNDYDPNMKKSISQPDNVVGAVTSWESDVDVVGKGSQTISKIEAPNLLEVDLKFLVPYESEAKGIISLVPEASGTKVTWAFESEIPYPFRVMMLWMNMEDAVGKDWNNGLGKLKALCEK